ncbi:type II toxin-antitoxin system RelE family toxin [Terriglobus sp.]|uniref:type II toxin-antitoxin system RelE family toxin n=1 Tax=Terriglobus sp. TaxID=1889013 RepID=UPI003AFF91A7
MAWSVKFEKRAEKALDSLDPVIAKRMLRYIHERLLTRKDPRDLGIAMQGNEHAGNYRFRVGDYRFICSINDEELIVVVVRLGHRREIYA